MRKTISSILIASTVLFGISCKKSDNSTPAVANVNFSATLNGASEVPANASAGSGTATISYNPVSKIMTVQVNFTGVTATASHIHQAAAGSNGAVVFPFTAPITSPISYTSGALDATQEAVLMANGYYVNVHSAAFPGGEIRGQLIKQ